MRILTDIPRWKGIEKLRFNLELRNETTDC